MTEGTGPLLEAPRSYPKRSELRRAEARAATRRSGHPGRPADGRPSGPAGGHRPPGPPTAARSAEAVRRPPANPYSLMPDVVAPTPASLPLPQASAWRPAGVDVPLPVSRDPFRPTVPLLGKGKAGAARLLVMALVVGAQGVGASYLAGHTFGGPDAANPELAASAFVLTDEEKQLRAAELEEAQAQAEQDRADAALHRTQRETAPSKAKAAFRQYRQAQLAAARVKAAAERREQALRNAQRDPKSAARLLVGDRGWSSAEFSCLDSLWTKESNWNYQATNAGSGAYGIPQSLPGSKMASAGSDWQTNPVTQIRWGLDYIAERYGTPCGAWNFSQAHNSY